MADNKLYLELAVNYTKSQKNIKDEIKKLQKDLQNEFKTEISLKDAQKAYQEIERRNRKANQDFAKLHLEQLRAMDKIEDVKAKAAQRRRNEELRDAQRQAQASNRYLEQRQRQEQSLINSIEQARTRSTLRQQREENRLAQAQARAVNSNLQRNNNLGNQVSNFQSRMGLQIDYLTGSSAGRYVRGQDSTALSSLRQQLQALSSTTPNVQQRMVQLRNEFMRINQNAQLLSRSTMNVGDAFKQAFQKFPIWITVSTAFMQTINAFREGIQYIYQMDTALTDLAKVTNYTASQLDGMRNSAIEMGKSLGHSSVDVMKSMAEFGRVTKNQEEIIALSKTATVASNVTSMSAETAAKALNTAMITFGVNAKDSMNILDQWNEMNFLCLLIQ